ncbi:C-type lectin domain family 4 member M-like [Microcaecilia unicolor]|uniref:C-type lectin domain family 4 member M-like n=1 Tax=Microcaecilia unicolor TaxID=1415580 RepID=A0A6P7X2Q6_9AMPH|nr:C-type lectin domain family 4 member M-like [Microcaecilia unicolor]
MAEVVTYSDIRFDKRKKLKPSQPRSSGSSVMKEDGPITFAAVRVQEESEENVNPESTKTEIRQKDLMCLTNEDFDLTLNQTQSQDALEELKKLEVLRDRYEYCLENWKPWKGMCYFVSNESKNWSSSYLDCKDKASQLALLKNSRDLESINISRPDYYWVGLWSSEGNWIWPDGTKSRNPTADSSPSCVVISTNAVHPTTCKEEHRWICQKSTVKLRLKEDYNFIVVSIDGTNYTEISSSVLQEDGDINYAAVRFPEPPEEENSPESPRTEEKQKVVANHKNVFDAILDISPITGIQED